MTGVHQAGALLCGYIDRPGTSAVVTLLKSITAVSDPTFNWRTLGTQQASQGLTDRDIFGEYCGFLWVSDGGDPKLFRDLGKTSGSRVRQYDEHWYWVSGG